MIIVKKLGTDHDSPKDISFIITNSLDSQSSVLPSKRITLWIQMALIQENLDSSRVIIATFYHHMLILLVTWMSCMCCAGRLYQVEYAMEAIGHSGSCLGILASDGIVLAAEKRNTNKLLDEVSYSEKIYKLNEWVLSFLVCAHCNLYNMNYYVYFSLLTSMDQITTSVRFF